MVKKLPCLLIILCALLLSTSTSASELFFGTRLAGMGGAGVALTDDVYAAYWNPAGLTRVDKFSIAPNISAFTPDSETIGEWVEYFGGKSSLPSEPATVATGGMFGFATSRFAMNMLGAVKVNANGSQESSEALLLYNSKLSMAYPIGLGSRTLSLGGTLNYYNGWVYAASLAEDWQNDSWRDVFRGQGQSMDFGAQVDLTKSIRLGFVARNLLANYDWSESASLASWQDGAPRYQAGIAWDRPSFQAAFDWEWNQEELRRYRVGFSKDLWIFTLRLGGIIEPEIEPTYTGGVSLRLGGVSFNMAAAHQDPAWTGTVSMAINL